jgi:hypothetical protein
MMTCGYSSCLIFAVLFLGMLFLCLAMCLGGFIRARRNGKSGCCCGSGAGGRDDESFDGGK